MQDGIRVQGTEAFQGSPESISHGRQEQARMMGENSWKAGGTDSVTSA